MDGDMRLYKINNSYGQKWALLFKALPTDLKSMNMCREIELTYDY